MAARLGRPALAALSVCATALLVAAAAAALRLAAGPVDLSLFAGRVAERLHAEAAPFVVSFDGVEASWSPWLGQVEVSLAGVRVDLPGGARVASAGRAQAAFGLAGLLRGRIDLEGVRLDAPRADLVRRADGSVGAGAAGAPLPALPAGTGPMRVALAGGELDLRDEGSGAAWRLRDADAVVEAGDGAWTAEVAASLGLGEGAPVRVEGEVRSGEGPEGPSGELAFRDLLPSAFADAGAGAGGLAALGIPLRGEVRFRVQDGAVQASVDARGGEGALDLSAALGEEGALLAVDSAAVRAAFDGGAGTLAIEEASIAAEGMDVRAKGRIRLGDGPEGRSGDLDFQGLVPSTLAAAGMDLGRLASLRAPLRGSLRFGSEDGAFRVTVDAEGEGGGLDLPDGPLDGGEAFLPVDSLRFRATLDADAGMVAVEGAVLDAAGMRVRMDGAFGLSADGPVDAEASLEGPVAGRDVIGRLRAVLGADAIAWLDPHLLAGDIREASLTLALPEGPEGPGTVLLEARVTGLGVDWAPGKPPLEIPESVLTIDGLRLGIESGAGTAGPAALADIRFVSPDLRAPAGEGIVTARVRGDAGGLLGLTGMALDEPGLVRGGVEAGLRLRIPFVAAEGETVEVEAVFGDLEILPGFLPGAFGEIPVGELAGTASYGADGLEVRAEGRFGDGLALSDVRLRAPGLSAEASLEGRVTGSARALLSLGEAVLSDDAAALPLVGKGAEGRAGMLFRARVPLGGGEPSIDGVEGTFEDLVIVPGELSGPFAGFGLEGVSGTLRLRPGWLTVEGAGSFAGSDIGFLWRDRVGEGSPDGGFVQALVLRGTLGEEAQALAGFDHLDLGGPVDVQGSLVRHAGEPGWRLTVDADLSRTEVGLPSLGWEKPAGAPLSARLSGEVEEEGPAGMSLLATGEGLAVEGTVTFADGGVSGASFGRFELGENRGVSEALVAPDGTVQVRFSGERLDLRPVLQADAGGPTSPARIEVAAEEVLTGGPRPVGPLHLVAVSGPRGLEEATGSIGLPGNDLLRLEVRRAGEALEIGIEGTDAGEAALALGLGGTLREGPFTIAAVRDETDPARAVRGHLRMEAFRLVEAPVLARLLQAATLVGTFEALAGGEGIGFSSFDGDFSLVDGVAEITDGTARGFSMGMKFDGSADTRAGTLDVSGVLIPGYVINEAFAFPNIVSSIVTGIDGDGVFAIDFEIRGQADDPEIVANPLSLLLPGILRDIFRPLLGGASGEGS